MKRVMISLLIILGILTGTGAYIAFANTLPQEHRTAAAKGITYLSEEYGIKEELMKTDKVTYWEEEDRFAVRIYNKEKDEYFDLALRLDENNEVAFILDVTGTFDEFGLAYCH